MAYNDLSNLIPQQGCLEPYLVCIILPRSPHWQCLFGMRWMGLKPSYSWLETFKLFFLVSRALQSHYSNFIFLLRISLTVSLLAFPVIVRTVLAGEVTGLHVQIWTYEFRCERTFNSFWTKKKQLRPKTDIGRQMRINFGQKICMRSCSECIDRDRWAKSWILCTWIPRNITVWKLIYNYLVCLPALYGYSIQCIT